ncbi:unnamed protein product, partial [Meganyctiphanes norvegica]
GDRYANIISDLHRGQTTVTIACHLFGRFLLCRLKKQGDSQSRSSKEIYIKFKDLKEIGKPDFNVGLSQYFVHKLIVSTFLGWKGIFFILLNIKSKTYSK